MSIYKKLTMLGRRISSEAAQIVSTWYVSRHIIWLWIFKSQDSKQNNNRVQVVKYIAFIYIRNALGASDRKHTKAFVNDQVCLIIPGVI